MAVSEKGIFVLAKDSRSISKKRLIFQNFEFRDFDRKERLFDFNVNSVLSFFKICFLNMVKGFEMNSANITCLDTRWILLKFYWSNYKTFVK